MNSASAPLHLGDNPTGPASLRGRKEARERDDPFAARLAGGSVRDLRGSWHAERDRADQDEGRPFELGWAASLLLNLVLLSTPIGLAIALPPVLACREREAGFGFFAAETLAKCSDRGIRQRLTLLDDRIKIFVRGSGR